MSLFTTTTTPVPHPLPTHTSLPQHCVTHTPHFPSTVSHTHTHLTSPALCLTQPPPNHIASLHYTDSVLLSPLDTSWYFKKETAPHLRVMSCASCFSSFLQETDIMSFTFNIQAITQVHSVNRVLGRALPFWQQSLSQTLTPFMQPSLHCC